MIYTVTLNPSIDYALRLPRFIEGITNRAEDESFRVGGKGVNVSRVLAALGEESVALGFTAGFTGEEIETALREEGVRTDFVRLPEGVSRVNVKLATSCESEINARGPRVSAEQFDALLQKLDGLAVGDTLVLAGSLPQGVPSDAYEIMLARLEGRNVRAVVDAAGETLLKALPHKPFLIKPNRQELSEIFGGHINSDRALGDCVEWLQSKGAQYVIVSLGRDGALLFAPDGLRWRSGVLHDPVLGTVGAGDSMVAGFLAGYGRTGDPAQAFRLATACGNATACSGTLATRDKIEEALCRLPDVEAMR